MAIEFEIRNAGGRTSTLLPASVDYSGVQFTNSAVLQWQKEGRVFGAQHGLLTTGGTVTATSIVRQQPDFLIRVPVNTVIVPVFVQVYFEATGGVLAEIEVGTSNNDPGTSNITQVTPVNANPKYGSRQSAVTTFKTATGATGTAPTNVSILLRGGSPIDLDSVASESAQFVYAPFNGQGVPTFVGGADAIHAFYVWEACGTSGASYITALWAEFTHAEVYGS